MLDGGIRAWVTAGLPLEVGDRVSEPGTVRLLDVDPGVATIDDAARAPIDGYLVDVRAPEHYRGLTPGLDPAAGHIPGAVNIPTVTHIAPPRGLVEGRAGLPTPARGREGMEARRDCGPLPRPLIQWLYIREV